MSQFDDLVYAADSIQNIILHNSLPQKGDIDEEKYDKLYGNIHTFWPYLRQFLNHKTQVACDEILSGLHTNYEGTKNMALIIFGNIVKDPRSHLRQDLYARSRS